MTRSTSFGWGRVRVPLAAAGLAALLFATFTDLLPAWLGVACFLAGLALYLRVGRPPARAPVEVEPPVRGRWRRVNDPEVRVPSHGLHAYGQTYAVDLVNEAGGAARPATTWWPPARRPEEYPGFGREVRAPARGLDVRSPWTWSR